MADEEPILKEEDSECGSEYSFRVRERCMSSPPRPVSWCSLFQYFAQMVGAAAC